LSLQRGVEATYRREQGKSETLFLCGVEKTFTTEVINKKLIGRFGDLL
jgi:hypothetical protein